jgi:polyribonucleotide nucleotidyltransferase
MQQKEYTVEIAGKTMTAIFSDLAEQASGSVILKCEDTVVLATACMSRDGKNNPGFFNLTVEYMERFYASGMILGGQYNKREGRPSDKAILGSRVIDRTIRPLFSQHIKNAVQVIVTVLSVGKMDPAILGVNAVSLALGVSPIPWNGPVGAVHAGIVRGGSELKVNEYVPSIGEPVYDLDLTVCGKDGKVVMIEASSFEKNESEMSRALDMSLDAIASIEAWMKKIIGEVGAAKYDMPKPADDEKMVALFADNMKAKFSSELFGTDSKKRFAKVEEEWATLLDQTYGKEIENRNELINRGKDYLHDKIDELVHVAAVNENKRVDLRAMDEVRALFATAGGLSPMLHGTGIFYRGQTHVLSVATLGGPETALEIEGMEVRGTKRFMHHYNFPPYSVGETGRLGGINRREMGHGFLAEKALAPVIPEKEKFPYTIRVVSESTSSNGSTSQGSICGATLALMDAGVPIKAPVAGIAMGVMIDGADESKYKILTDIQGPEDHHGDMDFKVAGTANGITAIQLDIKVGGIPPKILKETLEQAKTARLQILDVMLKVLSAPRADISPNAPKICVTKIKVSQIGLVIGPGGKNVNAIREETGAEITIDDDGTVYTTGKNGSAEKALAIIEGMTREWKAGDTAMGEVVKLMDFGAFVKVGPGTEGLVHVSEMAPFRIDMVGKYVKEGDRVPVTVLGVDEKGRTNFSIKKDNPEFFKVIV